MVLFASAIFFLSLVLIAALFALNLREAKTGRYPFPEWRDAADSEAIKLRELAYALDLDIKKVPPLLVHYAHVAAHFAALEFAYVTRQASRRAHAFADFVSHKRNFQRKETRSDFLRKMSELKNGVPLEENGQDASDRVEF